MDKKLVRLKALRRIERGHGEDDVERGEEFETNVEFARLLVNKKRAIYVRTKRVTKKETQEKATP